MVTAARNEPSIVIDYARFEILDEVLSSRYAVVGEALEDVFVGKLHHRCKRKGTFIFT